MRYRPWSSGSWPSQARSNQTRYERIKPLMNKMKTDRGCDICGYNEYAGALHWDHRPDEVKVANVGSLWGIKPEKLMAEIAKCDLLCSNCHAEVTHSRRTWDNGWSKNCQKPDPHPRLWEESS